MTRKEKLFDLLVKFIHVSTWEGVNKHGVRGIIQGYANQIDELYKIKEIGNK